MLLSEGQMSDYKGAALMIDAFPKGLATAKGTNFLVRTCVDRLAGDGSYTINAEMAEVSVQGLHRVMVPSGAGKLDEASGARLATDHEPQDRYA